MEIETSWTVVQILKSGKDSYQLTDGLWWEAQDQMMVPNLVQYWYTDIGEWIFN